MHEYTQAIREKQHELRLVRALVDVTPDNKTAQLDHTAMTTEQTLRRLGLEPHGGG
jgi:hypothetical protein